MNKWFTVAIVAALGSSAFAGINLQINEIFVNPPGTDNGQEFFELRGSSNQSMAGLWLIVIDGDGTSAGVVDQAINLGSFSTGSNGLFLWRDSSSNPVSWNDPDNSWAVANGPLAGTSVNSADFNPDLENGSNTFALVSGFAAAVGTDLDSNDDGTLNVTPWGSVIDAISLVENDSGVNAAYADEIGGTVFGPNAGFNADLLFRVRNYDDMGGTTWAGSDVIGTNPGGPYAIDTARYATLDPLGPGALSSLSKWTATPGGQNPVPEPATLAALGFGVAALARKRRK